MEKSLKFNSSICTTIKQSQRLLDLGLKPETADMLHQYLEAEFDWFIFPCDDWDDWDYATSENLIPAWSLHRLMVIFLSHFDNSSLIFRNEQSPYDLLISDIEQMIKDGYFNKEYLSNERI